MCASSPSCVTATWPQKGLLNDDSHGPNVAASAHALLSSSAAASLRARCQCPVSGAARCRRRQARPGAPGPAVSLSVTPALDTHSTTTARSSGDTCEPRAPETPAYEDEGVSAMQRAFFEIQPREPVAKEASREALPALQGGMHRCASAPAIRESISSWHLAMVINAIGSPKADGNGSAAGVALNPRHRRSSAVDLSVLSQ